MFVKQDIWSTHQPLLMLAIANTEGAILELGVGHYSTALIHAASSGRRQVLSVEHDLEWLKHFEWLRTPWHRIEFLELLDLTKSDVLSNRWSVCLVDLEPTITRGACIAYLRPNVEIFVCHDTDWYDGHNYHVLDTFKYIRHDKRFPRTSLVSDVIDVNQWPEV